MRRGGAKQPLIRRCPNGETPQSEISVTAEQSAERTVGSETSQYHEEKKPIGISLVAASERESSPNRKISQAT